MTKDQRPMVFVVHYYNLDDDYYTHIDLVFEVEQEAKDKVKQLNRLHGWDCAQYTPTILIKK